MITFFKIQGDSSINVVTSFLESGGSSVFYWRASTCNNQRETVMYFTGKTVGTRKILVYKVLNIITQYIGTDETTQRHIVISTCPRIAVIDMRVNSVLRVGDVQNIGCSCFVFFFFLSFFRNYFFESSAILSFKQLSYEQRPAVFTPLIALGMIIQNQPFTGTEIAVRIKRSARSNAPGRRRLNRAHVRLRSF